jgi:hypothetical protein
MTARPLVRCHVCDPAEEFDIAFIFEHWREVHGLDFEVMAVEPPGAAEQERLWLIDLDALDAKIGRLPWWLRWWYERQARQLRKDANRARDRSLRTWIGGDT